MSIQHTENTTEVANRPIDVRKYDDGFGPYVTVELTSGEQHFSIINGEVFVTPSTDERVIDALESEGYETSLDN